jgi:predicted RNA-binding protein with PIN domain
MKPSGKGSNTPVSKQSSLPGGTRHSKCLIVDGYNILARMWKGSLQQIADLNAARTTLLEELVEYQAYFGEQVFLVFDAQHTPDAAVQTTWRGVVLIYTAQHETADQRIERLVYDLRLKYHSITVASSDFAEQQVTFGGGALRISAEELIRRLRQAQNMIKKTVSERRQDKQNAKIRDTIRHDIAKIFEKWRRE